MFLVATVPLRLRCTDYRQRPDTGGTRSRRCPFVRGTHLKTRSVTVLLGGVGGSSHDPESRRRGDWNRRRGGRRLVTRPDSGWDVGWRRKRKDRQDSTPGRTSMGGMVPPDTGVDRLVSSWPLELRGGLGWTGVSSSPRDTCRCACDRAGGRHRVPV